MADGKMVNGKEPPNIGVFHLPFTIYHAGFVFQHPVKAQRTSLKTDRACRAPLISKYILG
jgi:hypothetical protein